MKTIKGPNHQRVGWNEGFFAVSRHLVLLLGIALMASACTKAHLIGRFSKVAIVPITIRSIVPSMGTTNGGTHVAIYGTGFVPGSTVLLGSLNCNDVEFISSSELTCVTPSTTLAGDTPVSVITPNASGSGLMYTYIGSMPDRHIASGGVFSTSGTIRVRASIATVSGAVPNGMQTGTGIIKLGGLQGVIKFRN